MSTVANHPSLFFTCLERFEKQSREISNRNELVEFFCLNVLPFLAENTTIENLRNEWRIQRDQLHQKIQETDARALTETKTTFREVKTTVGDSGNEVITKKISLIERLITGQEK